MWEVKNKIVEKFKAGLGYKTVSKYLEKKPKTLDYGSTANFLKHAPPLELTR